MKGIILAGGSGTRLFPTTISVSKHLLPVFDKPMIYYPLSALLLMEIREILIITKPSDLSSFQMLLGDGTQIGINISYATQANPNGIAEAFLIGERFIGDDSVCLILGDNIFYGDDLAEKLKQAASLNNDSIIFGYLVKNPKDFGVVVFDKFGKITSIEEKPKNPKSKYAIPGLYIYKKNVINFSKLLNKSSRGELEISDLNNYYLKMNKLSLVLLGRGIAWLDTGTPSGLLRASEFVDTIQSRQGFYISCIEEIAWRNNFINTNQLLALGEKNKATDYGNYLVELALSNLNKEID
jgi:glucose-1-phosphate thymidylyltransferase